MCNCVVEVTAKVASHLESQGVEIVGTPVMDAALMLDSMQLTTSTKIHYVQKVVNKKGERLVKKSVSITHRFCPFCGGDKQKQAAYSASPGKSSKRRTSI